MDLENSQSSRLRAQLEDAWLAKIDFRMDEALALATQVKASMIIPSGYLTGETVAELLAKDPTGLTLDTLCLSAEIERYLGNVPYSKELFRSIEQCTAFSTQHQSFWASYTKAMSYFSSGDFFVALEELLRAKSRCQNEAQKIIVEGNLLFCMESQGLPYESTKRNVEKLLEGSAPEALRSRVACQLHALKLRELFRAGSISQLLKVEAERKSTKVDQGYFYSLWISQLPYSSSYRKLLPSDYERFTTGNSYQLYRDYRLRTLQGVLHPDEKTMAKPSEFVERFYLWTWRWLTQTEASSIEKVLLLLKEFTPNHLAHRIGVEDAVLLTNALLWITVFDPTSTTQVMRVIQQLETVHSLEFPILRLENLTLHCILALRDQKEALANEYWNTLRNHPLWSSKETIFPLLAEFAMGKKDSLPANLSALEKSLRNSLDKENSHTILIDMATSEIKTSEQGEPVFSESLCAGVSVLKKHGRMPAEAFSNVCFGISKYDTLIHAPKIQNLLSRMKNLIGKQLKFGMKNGVVFAEGDWKGIQIKEGPALVGFCQQMADFEGQLFQKKKTAEPVPVTGQPPVEKRAFQGLPWKEGVTRNQLEGFLGRPRSTVNRMLKRWLDEGKIVRSGSTRASRYFLNQPSANSSAWRES